jgi:hypothetical protein
MSQSNLRVSNVTVDKAVQKAEIKILSEIPTPTPTPTPPVATAVDADSFIRFTNVNFSKELIITGGEVASMAKSGVVIVDHTKPDSMNLLDPYILLFDAQNSSIHVDAIISIFNLSSTTPSRLIRVIRSGINALFPTSLIAETIFGISAEVPAPSAIKYIFFQVNGNGGDSYTKTPSFLTYSDWSFVVTLQNDIIDGQTYNRICFNVII